MLDRPAPANVRKQLRRYDGLSRIVDGPLSSFPLSPSQMSMWRRLMTGVGNRTSYVEFDALSAELQNPSGIKSLFGRYQQVIPGQVDLTVRNAVYGTSEFNWLDATVRYRAPAVGAAGAGYLWYNSSNH